MKQLIILFSFLGSFLFAHSQVLQRNNTWYEFKLIKADTLLLYSDTISIPSSLRTANYALAAKDDILYLWSKNQLKWLAAGHDSAAITTNWGTILGSISAQSDLTTALNLRVPKTTTITIDGTTYDLSTNRTWGDFLNPADTMYLHNTLTTLQTYTNNLTFSDGLHQNGNNVVALHDEANWNANKIQGRFVSSATPLNGQVYAWDSVLLVWKPTTITSGSTITAGYGLTGTTTFKVDTSLVSTLAHLYKVADSLGNLISSGGATPTLQQVITAGSTLTADNIINASTHYLDISSANGGFHYSDNSGYWYSGVDGTHYTEVQFQSSNSSMSSNYAQLHSSYASAQNYLTVYPDFVDITSPIVKVNTGLDTLATLADLRAGGGGGSTAGIDDVLAVGQSLTASREIDATTGFGFNILLARDAINGDSYTYIDPANFAYGPTFGGQIVSNDSVGSISTTKYGNSIRAHKSGTSVGVDVTYQNGVDIFDNSTDLYVIDGEMGLKAASLFIDPLNTNTFHAGYVLTDVAGDGYATWQPVSGGSTPGIDNVLGVGQALSTNRTINLNSHTLTLDNASSITSALLLKNTNTTAIYMPNTTDLTLVGNGGGSLTVQGNGFIKTPYYGFPTGSFHMNTGTFNGVATYWNTSGVLIEKAAGATNIISKTFSNTGEEVYPFQGTVKVDATSGNTTLILGDPADGGFNTGGIMTFIKTDASANTVTVDAWTNWSATVNGVHTKTLTAQWQYIIVQSDGTNWYVVGGN